MSTFTSALKRLTAAVVATASVVALTACGSGGARDLLADIESGHVVMGTKYDQPNLGERTPDKQFAGLDTDVSRYVVEYIAKKHGWATPEIEWRETPSAQRETLINNGEVNMITATYSINKGRLKAVDFAGPYLVTHQALLVREDSGIKGLNDIAPGTRLCSVSGSTPAQKVKEALPSVQLQEYDTYSSCVEALSQGNVDAMTTDATILNGYAAQNPGKFQVVELEKDGKPFTDEYYGAGLKKDDQEATDAVNKALEELHSSGEFDKLVAKNLDKGEGIDEATVGDLSFLNS